MHTFDMSDEMPDTRRDGFQHDESGEGSGPLSIRGPREPRFDESEAAWFDRPSSRPSAPPSIEKIRAAFRSSAPPAPAAKPIGDELVDEWLTAKRRS